MSLLLEGRFGASPSHDIVRNPHPVESKGLRMFKNVQTVDWTDVQEAQAGQAGLSLTRTAMNPNSPVLACKNPGATQSPTWGC